MNYNISKKENHDLFRLKWAKNKQVFKDLRLDIEKLLPKELYGKYDILICNEVIEHLP